MKLFIVLLFLALLVQPAAASFSGYIKNWVIIGPFPNPERKPGSNDRGAFDIDYLKTLGGETKAVIKPGTSITADSTKLSAIPVELSGTMLDFKAYYADSDNKLAYAYAQIDSPSDQEALFFLGSDDGAKVWVNGKKVFEVLVGRSCIPRQDRFKARLRQGANSILVKVENGSGDWKLVLEAYSSKEARKIETEIKNEENRREFLNQELALAKSWPGYVFWKGWGGAPKIIWRDVERVREIAGDIPFKVRWFDSNLNEVKEPSEPGRYGAYIEAKMKDGTPIRRAMTFFCAPGDLNLWADWDLPVQYLGKPIDPEVWKEMSSLVAQQAGRLYRDSLVSTQDGAILLAGLCEARPNGSVCGVTESPEVLHDDYHLRLKLKLMNLSEKTRPLAPPKQRNGNPAPVLHEGTPEEAGVKPDAKQKIDAVCRQWAEESREPFSILVARRGVIVTHAAFGKTPDGVPVDTNYRTEVASITKAITGMLFSQFIDQGFVKLDDPIGNYVPGFPVKGERALTYRHLFTHTSGLGGHGEWGGIHNPHLENVILNGLSILHPGRTHIYNGMGYDLAGKAMEYMTGKSIIRLFHDNLYRPLGIENVPQADLAFGARLTSYELGVLGQWLANHGSYGDKQFISEETFKQLLPEPLGKYYPGIELEWGIGLTWFREQKPGSPAGSTNPQDLILSERVIGHGSATSCVLRVDLDKDLVVAQVRKGAGERYAEYLQKFLMTIADSLL